VPRRERRSRASAATATHLVAFNRAV
jgi:hypothetical protein